MTSNSGNSLSNLLDRASLALGYSDHYPAGFTEPTSRVSVPAVATGVIRFKELLPLKPIVVDTRYPNLAYEQKSATQIPISDSILKQSKIAQFGSQIVVVENAPENASSGGMPLLYERQSKFRLVKPAKFATIADGASIGLTAYPVASVTPPIRTAPTSAFSMELTRRDQKNITEDQLAYEVMAMISLGLAREADRILLSAIVAASPSSFTLAKAATAGLNFAGLRAFIGTSGTNASINSLSQLVAGGGILAELTDVIAPTIIGAFDNTAVFVHDDILLNVERINVNGAMKITALVNITAALPETSLFWTA